MSDSLAPGNQPEVLVSKPATFFAVCLSLIASLSASAEVPRIGKCIIQDDMTGGTITTHWETHSGVATATLAQNINGSMPDLTSNSVKQHPGKDLPIWLRFDGLVGAETMLPTRVDITIIQVPILDVFRMGYVKRVQVDGEWFVTTNYGYLPADCMFIE